MKERRQYERFMFALPVRIETMMTGRKKVLDLAIHVQQTSLISA